MSWGVVSQHRYRKAVKARGVQDMLIQRIKKIILEKLRKTRAD